MAEENVTRDLSVARKFDNIEESLEKAGAIAQLLVMNPHGLADDDASWPMAAVRDLIYEAKSTAEDIRNRLMELKAGESQ